MRSHNDYLEEQLKNPDFAAAYEALEPQYQIARAIIAARLESGMTQAELAKKAELPQSNISRLESGNFNPTVQTLEKVAAGLGKKLTLKFV
ncbi:MAG: helix-turn-helix domain-containing protein [Christensenellales bacterium]|jgi:ribosome-binding protein aMBF1 (putative translation factor)|nr:helix-turn-helix transcriptional regulator [Christensenellaceae bacterium]